MKFSRSCREVTVTPLLTPKKSADRKAVRLKKFMKKQDGYKSFTVFYPGFFLQDAPDGNSIALSGKIEKSMVGD
ncbi:MAG: hypothetical protein Q4D81_05795 [Eubacteriales bacterium]|nr:hypothetical protein [Eubacteriales bacterium]